MSTPSDHRSDSSGHRGDERMSYLDFLLHTASLPGGSELFFLFYVLVVITFFVLIAFLSSYPTITMVILTVVGFVIVLRALWNWRFGRAG